MSDDFYKKPDKSYFDNLVRVLTASRRIEIAYFGMLYDEQEDSEELFLAIAHQGEPDEVKEVAEIVRNTYLPNRRIGIASSVADPELFNFIQEHNFPFYIKERLMALPVAIMNMWFDPERQHQEFLFQIRNGSLYSLFKDFNSSTNVLQFQTFVRDGKEFIPLFSDHDMIYKSGMTEIPPDLTPLKFDWAKIDSAVEGRLQSHLYVLNPGTSFEIEFRT